MGLHGTWRTTGGDSSGTAVVIVGAAVVAAVVVSWIITRLVLVTLFVLALLAVAVMVVLVVRRIRHPEGAVQIARPVPVLHADAEVQATGARPAAAGITYHGGTHLHLDGRTADPRVVIAALAALDDQPPAVVYPPATVHLEGGDEQ